MSLDPEEPASDTGDENLSAITFDSDLETGRVSGCPSPRPLAAPLQKPKRKSGHRPLPVSPKSPYYSKPRSAVASWRSLRTAESMPLNARVPPASQKLWPGASKQGSLTQPPQAALTWEQAWSSPPRSASDCLTEALRMRRANPKHSASHGRVPGTPAYREKEDMYDEIIELKKSLHTQKSDMDLLRTKLRRLEEENSRKDRQIEQLLDAARGPDFIRTLAEKRADSSWVVTGLKQRILKLEQQCRDKDSTINKLQTDMKTTNLEEMRIAMETYYEEIHRLQTLLATSEAAGRKLPTDKKLGARRPKKMSSVLLDLSRNVQELTEENRSLKEDLDRLLSHTPATSKIRGYMEWSKPRLLRRITELEMKLSTLESSRPQASELEKPCVESPRSLSCSSAEPQQQHQGSECLWAIPKGLKGEQATTVCFQQPEKEEQDQAPSRKLPEQEEAETRTEDEAWEATCEAHEDPQPPVPASSHSWPDLEPDPSPAHSRPPSAHSEGRREDCRRDTAARLLQARWKARNHEKREAALDEAATVLQAAFRGHLVRAQLLASRSCASSSPRTSSPPWKHPKVPCSQSPAIPDSPELEKAVVLIQAVFRAHLARAQARGPSLGAAATASTSWTSITSAKKDASSPASCAASPGHPTEPPAEAHNDSEATSGETEEESAAEEETLAPGKRNEGPTPSRPPPEVPPPVAEVCSDDSDSDDVISPALPGKKKSGLS